jgi:hypothetical protein
MDKISQLDSSYERFIGHLEDFIPEGIEEVDLDFLNRLQLLHDNDHAPASRLTRFFHVVETKEKVTLFNEQFVVWIVPERVQDEAMTLVLLGIASGPMHSRDKEQQDNPLRIHLETAFSASGVYNTSRTVLRVVERLLSDIQENEEVISHLEA